MIEDFSTGEPRLDFWNIIFGGTVQTLFAGRSLSLVFGSAASSRLAQSAFFDTTNFKTLEFDLIYGDGSNGGDAIDGNNDLIQLEYTTNKGVSWQVLQTYAAPIAWTRFKINLPAAAQAASTRLRWRQPANDGAGKDYWALDNIELKTTPFVPPPALISAMPSMMDSGVILREARLHLLFQGAPRLSFSAAREVPGLRRPLR